MSSISSVVKSTMEHCGNSSGCCKCVRYVESGKGKKGCRCKLSEMKGMGYESVVFVDDSERDNKKCISNRLLLFLCTVQYIYNLQ